MIDTVVFEGVEFDVDKPPGILLLGRYDGESAVLLRECRLSRCLMVIHHERRHFSWFVFLKGAGRPDRRQGRRRKWRQQQWQAGKRALLSAERKYGMRRTDLHGICPDIMYVDLDGGNAT